MSIQYLQVSHPRCVLRKYGWLGPLKHNCRRIVFYWLDDDYMFPPCSAISVSHQAENSTPKSLLRMSVHSILITQKSKTAKRPADPEEAPSEPTPEPTPEHPVGHPNLSTKKDRARNSADPQCLSILQCRLLF